MSVQWIIVVSYADRSGVMGAYGPYPDKSSALDAIPDLHSLLGYVVGQCDVVRLVTL